MRRLVHLEDYKSVLPYASEIFGVYQPLFGWRGKRSNQRITEGFGDRRIRLVDAIEKRFAPQVSTRFADQACEVEITDLVPGRPQPVEQWGAMILEAIGSGLEADATDNAVRKAVDPDRVREALDTVVAERAKELYRTLCTASRQLTDRIRIGQDPAATVTALLRRESAIAGALVHLGEAGAVDQLRGMLRPKVKDKVLDLLGELARDDPFETIDPKKDLARVGLSPVGIVHLFRQYFFELDTFLGSPAGHIWVSPGATVELAEVSTRKTTIERTEETAFERVVRTESSTTDEEEIAEAVKKDNRTDTKLGASVSSSQDMGIVSATETASFDYGTTQQEAREQSHKRMRQQTDKLTTEIKQSFKTTFKVVTETTESSSKRYVLTNSTGDLINYELRRKMRQVGVQVQDIGSYLCWQTYVDDPGKQLGIATLMHLAASPDVASIPHPETIVAPKPILQPVPIQLQYIGEDDENDISYSDGTEEDVGWGENTDHIQADFPQTVFCEGGGAYTLIHVDFDTTGVDAKLSYRNLKQDPGSPKAEFDVHLDHVNFGGQGSISVKMNLHWEPVYDQKAIDDANATRLAAYTAAQEREYRKAYVDAAKERIEIAAAIDERPYEDLREEERVVVYRRLIQDLLAPSALVPTPDDRTRHVVAELLNSIFDVDKMLYFVAPEWWRPRLHQSSQELGSLVPQRDKDGKVVLGPDGAPVMVGVAETQIPTESLVGWGGVAANRPDNYHVTGKSERARLGSSLGWLLQLDGDPMRNAFLNAPWVKAVMPIRPGKEREALNWLQQVEGMDTLTADDLYTGPEPDLQGKTIFEALHLLGDRVAAKHRESITVKAFPDPDAPLDDDSTVHCTPVDKVYEHGFYPLQGGFKASVGEDFELVDQWIEVVPTDQVAAVAVTYDPKTGRQL